MLSFKCVVFVLFLYFIVCCQSQSYVSDKSTLISSTTQYIYPDQVMCLFDVEHYVEIDGAQISNIVYFSPDPSSKSFTLSAESIKVRYQFNVSTSTSISGSINFTLAVLPDMKFIYSYTCKYPSLKNPNGIQQSQLIAYSSGWIKGFFMVKDFNSLVVLPLLNVDDSKSSYPCNISNNCMVLVEGKVYALYFLNQYYSALSGPLNVYFNVKDYTNPSFNVTFNSLEIHYDKINFYKINSIKYYPSDSSNIIQPNNQDFKQYSIINITTDNPIDYLFGFNDGFIRNAMLISNTENKLNSLWLSSSLSRLSTSTLFWNNDKELSTVKDPSSNLDIIGPLYSVGAFTFTSFKIGGTPTTSSILDSDNKAILRTFVINGLTGSPLSTTVKVQFANSIAGQYINKFMASSPFGVILYSPLDPSSNVIYFPFQHSDFIPNSNFLSIEIETYRAEASSMGSVNTDSQGGVIKDLKFKYLGYNYWSIQLTYQPGSSDSGFMKLNGFSSTLLKKSDLITNLNYATVFSNQFRTFTSDPSNSYLLLKNSGDSKNYQFNAFPYVPKFPATNEFFEILDLYFKIPAMNLTSRGGYNSVYLKIRMDNIDNLFYLQPFFALTPKLNYNIHFNKYVPFYLVQKGLYQADFYVPSHLTSGELDYSIGTPLFQAPIHSDLIKFKLSYNSLANLRSYSKESDTMPPIVSSIIVKKDKVEYDLDSTVYAEWVIGIEEGLNGFDWGFITVSSLTADYAKYFKNITFTQLDSKNQVLIQVPVECTNYNLEITNLTLIDKQGFISRYSKYYKESDSEVLDPFMKVISSKAIPSVQVSCSLLPNSDPGSLVISSSLNEVDAFSFPNISFSVTFSHIDRVSLNQLPTLYLIGDLEETPIQVPLIPDTLTSDGIQKFIGSTILPFGFAYPHRILVSVFGLSTKRGDWFGQYSELAYSIKTKLPPSGTPPPVILNTSPFYSTGGTLFIYGKGLTVPSTIIVTQSSTEKIYNANLVEEGSVIYIILPEIEEEFSIRYSEGVANNILVIKPIVAEDVIEAEERQIPLPTNAPQQCLGSPVCGGTTQGYCSDKGCVCYSPWIGESCQSRVITIPPPSSNPNEPSSNLTLSDDFTLVNIISLVSLREMDLYGNKVKVYRFGKWNQTQISKNINHYSSNVRDNYENDSSAIVCSISVETIWYEELSNITFANQQLIMNPSTLKYNINITSYPFESKLNTLQLIISASSKANSDDTSLCSSQEFGETVTDNSNYINFKIGEHSLYSRFIKRAIVDSKFTSLSNQILSEFTNQTYYKSESLVAISIPNYEFMVSLDPDFSIILNPSSANSICKDNSGLSKGAIIGIVVGCVGGAIIITISILLIIKFKYQIKVIKNSIKLKQFN